MKIYYEYAGSTPGGRNPEAFADVRDEIANQFRIIQVEGKTLQADGTWKVFQANLLEVTDSKIAKAIERQCKPWRNAYGTTLDPRYTYFRID